MKHMTAVRKYASKIAAPVSIGFLALCTQAHAALPAAVDTTLSVIQSDAESLFAKVFPVVGVILGLMIVLKLFKRFANKA